MNEFTEVFNKIIEDNRDKYNQTLEKLLRKRIVELEEENTALQEKIDRLSLLLTRKMDI
jgi:hypothetical protein|nr:MAG TPA: Protein SOGA [Caudoviricetes sp.]